MPAINHTDWEVTKQHAQVINDNWPSGVGVRKPEVRKTIPGVYGTRISQGIRSGIWMKPLGSLSGRTYSGVRDIQRSTLVVFAQATTTAQLQDVTDYERIRELVRDLFHDRRGTQLNGEVYSRIRTMNYDMDDGVSREYDVDVIEIMSWFREERINDLC